MAQSGHGERGGEQVIFLAPGGGRLYEQGGFRGAIKVDAKESGGRQCFSEWTVDAGDNGRPPHLHREHQEAFFVVEGTLTFRAGEETIKAEAGSFLFIPSGVVHTFSNRSLVAWHRSTTIRLSRRGSTAGVADEYQSDDGSRRRLGVPAVCVIASPADLPGTACFPREGRVMTSPRHDCGVDAPADHRWYGLARLGLEAQACPP
jgi:mannose-6-phosphate isomerase-like protein (cupin superfamily)